MVLLFGDIYCKCMIFKSKRLSGVVVHACKKSYLGAGASRITVRT
jgi:hypothetical protein